MPHSGMTGEKHPPTKPEDAVHMVLSIASLQFQHKTVLSLLDLFASSPFDGYAISAICLLPQARNATLNLLYENNPNFTHCLFLDDDMAGFTIDHIRALWQADKPIISALVTGRKPPYKLVIFSDDTDAQMIEHIKKQEVIHTQRCGFAFTLVKREVLDAVREETPDGSIWFTTDRSARDEWETDAADEVKRLYEMMDNEGDLKDTLYAAMDFGRCAHIGARLVGEDVAFCIRAKDAGYKTYVHCGVPVGHIGETTFDWRYALSSLLVADKDFIGNLEKADAHSKEPKLSIVSASDDDSYH